MNNNYISVVLPIYNQFQKLDIVLQHFSNQNLENIYFEIIVVDDGSTDQLSIVDKRFLKEKYNIANVEIMHTQNGGRAVARNNGMHIAQGQFIIFCDGDRMPSKDYLLRYKNAILNHDIIVGGPMDYFGPSQLARQFNNDDQLLKFSRYPLYYKNACEYLYDKNGMGCSSWSWLGFLVGNSCVKKQILLDIDGFSLDFSDWGFEHFEIAYRMLQAGYNIYNNCKIISFHLIHGRPSGFYKEQIDKSLELMEKKYLISKTALMKLFFDKDAKYNFQILMEVANEKR